MIVLIAFAIAVMLAAEALSEPRHEWHRHIDHLADESRRRRDRPRQKRAAQWYKKKPRQRKQPLTEAIRWVAVPTSKYTP